MMLTSTTHARSDATVLRLYGTLNACTYKQVRDLIVKAAIDHARAVVVDVNDLEAGDGDSWAVFTSARWCVQQWPEVPIALVSSDPSVRRRLTALSVARYVPVYDTLSAACDAVVSGACRYRHRVRESFGPHASSVNFALIFVHEHLVKWSMREKIPVAETVATVLAENALSYARGGFDLRLEGTDSDVVVAVSDSSSALAVPNERAPGSVPSGLDIVSSLCRRWGNTPTATGKTVWARIGAEDTFAGIADLSAESR